MAMRSSLGEGLHKLGRGTVGDRFGGVVPAGGLFGAEVGAVENLLQADDLRACGCCLSD